MIVFQVLASLLIVGSIVFLVTQFATTFFSVRYLAQLVGMLSLAGLSVALLVIVLTNDTPALAGLARTVVTTLMAMLISLWFGLSIVKLVFFTDTRVSTSYDLLTRNLCSLSIAHKRFSVCSSDAVDIQGYHIDNGNPEVVIFCHGGGSSKNALGSVLSCEWLSADYDVIGFDFRGHLESGGTWVGDERTALDVKAVVDYARGFDYQKVALVGMSMGGWSAIAEAALYRNVDAVVAASPPPTTMRSVVDFQPLFDWGMAWWSAPVRWGVRIMLGIRFESYGDDLSIDTLVDDMGGIPLLLTFYTRDPVIGLDADEFRETLYDKASAPKQIKIYQGTAHVTTPRDIFRFHSDVQDWLAEHL